MSVLPSNTNQALRFITDEPDWSKGVMVTDFRRTSVRISRAGLEVRQRHRLVPRIQIEFTVSGLTNDEYFARVQQALLDARAGLVIPLRTDVETAGADSTGPNHTDLAITNARRPGLFKVGDYIYTHDGTTGQFRQIASITDSTNFVLETTGSPQDILQDDPIYPCLVFEQLTHDVDFTRYAPESRELRLKFRSIEVPATPTSYATTPGVEGTTVINSEGGF